MNILYRIQQIQRAEVTLAGFLAVVALMLSIAGVVQLTSADQSNYGWSGGAANPHWMRVWASPAAAILAAFVTPLPSLYLVIMHVGAGVGAIIQGHILDGVLLFVMGGLTLIPSAIGIALHGLRVKLVNKLLTSRGGAGNSQSASAHIAHREPVAHRTIAQSNPESSDHDADLSQQFKPISPRIDFSSLDGMDALKAQLLEAGKESLRRATGKAAGRNGVLLHGDPGNGKTAFAEALAGQLKVPFMQVTIGDVGSRWVGQTPEQLRAVFASAQRHAPMVLFLDEVDSIIANRSDSSSSGVDDRKNTNVFLTEAVRLRGTGVVLIAATNLIESLDPAAVREGRFDWKIEIPNPDLAARRGIIKKSLADAKREVTDDVLDSLAVRWVGFSVARLRAVAREAAITSGVGPLSFSDFHQALRRVQGNADRVPESAKELGDLILSERVRKTLEGVVSRLKDPFDLEQQGGTLPSGLLFAGPPGTGKTEAARAIARETGWSFIVTSGSELTKDRNQLNSVYKRACDSRPSIVFIDEADDVLRDRATSYSAHVTNELLTIMEGSKDRVRDVVFIAATNNPDIVDQALLRAGRFTEKAVFENPSHDDLVRYLISWSKVSGWGLGGDVKSVASMLTGQSIANVRGVLNVAVNRAIASGRTRSGSDDGKVILESDFQEAMDSVLG